MAKSSDKRRLEENKVHSNKIKNAIIISNAIFFLVKFVIFRASITRLQYIGTAITTLLFYLCYGAISNALAPHYASNGELIFAGSDLKTGSLEYYHDIIYLCIFTQFLAIWTKYAWITLALIPGYALYKLIFSLILPQMTSNQPQPDVPESDAEKKRREKKERQSSRRQRFAS